MKNIIKTILTGICMVFSCTLIAACTYEVFVAFCESFKAVGITAIIWFILATMYLAMLLFAYWLIGDGIMNVKEKNVKKNEVTT